MVEIDASTLIEISEDENEIYQIYGEYVKEKRERLSIEIQLEQLAESVLQKMDESAVADMDYSDESIDLLENIIDSAFENSEKEYVDQDLVDSISTDLGSYFGLTIIKSLGGEWRFRKDLFHSSIYFGSIDKECFPFHKLTKRLLYGKNESLSNFYSELLEIMDSL